MKPLTDPRADSPIGRQCRAERIRQMTLALELRRQGKTYQQIASEIPVTLANGHGFLDTPRPRSKTNVSKLLFEALDHFFEDKTERFREAGRLDLELYGDDFRRGTYLPEPAKGAFEHAFRLNDDCAPWRDQYEAWLVAADAVESINDRCRLRYARKYTQIAKRRAAGLDPLVLTDE